MVGSEHTKYEGSTSVDVSCYTTASWFYGSNCSYCDGIIAGASGAPTVTGHEHRAQASTSVYIDATTKCSTAPAAAATISSLLALPELVL